VNALKVAKAIAIQPAKSGYSQATQAGTATVLTQGRGASDILNAQLATIQGADVIACNKKHIDTHRNTEITGCLNTGKRAIEPKVKTF